MPRHPISDAHERISEIPTVPVERGKKTLLSLSLVRGNQRGTKTLLSLTLVRQCEMTEEV